MISRATAYAAKALGRAAAVKGRLVLVRKLGKDSGVPAAYLAKIMQTLARAGLVTTRRGTRGGVTLARSPDRITLHDLCVALSDRCLVRGCLMGDAACERGCPCRGFCRAHHAAIVRFLRTTTIADMASAGTGRARATARRLRRKKRGGTPRRRAPRDNGVR